MATKDVSVVLAHGAWADGSSWARVITGLTAHGLKASAVPMPLTSLADDVAALNRSIERTPGVSCWRHTPMQAPSLRSRDPNA
jgi:hypothetical protein